MCHFVLCIKKLSKNACCNSIFLMRQQFFFIFETSLSIYDTFSHMVASTCTGALAKTSD